MMREYEKREGKIISFFFFSLVAKSESRVWEFDKKQVDRRGDDFVTRRSILKWWKDGLVQWFNF